MSKCGDLKYQLLMPVDRLTSGGTHITCAINLNACCHTLMVDLSSVQDNLALIQSF